MKNDTTNSPAPVEVPFEGEDFDLDSFLDTLKPQTRMKVVREMEGDDSTGATVVARSVPVAPAQTGPGSLRAWQKVVLVSLVAPALLVLYLAVLAGRLADNLLPKLVNYTKESLNAGK